MPILDCSVKTCTYNKENSCCLNNIKVDGPGAKHESETLCKSFQTATESAKSYAMEPSMELVVNCDAVNCTFNEQRVCHAGHIGIAGSSAKTADQTECASFRPKA